MFWIFVFTSCLRVVFSRVVHHLKRGGMKGKAERVSSVKVIKKPTEKKRPGPRFEPGSEDPQSSRITNYPTLANVPFTFAPDSD
jgi:hypothetical protein